MCEDPDQELDLPKVFVVETQFRDALKIAVYGEDWEYVENLDNHEGTNPRELHPAGVNENGAETDVAGREPTVVSAFETFLRAWENGHPGAPATPASDSPSPELIERLRSIGYVQ